LQSRLINRTVLPNEIRVLSEKIPHVRSCAIGVWVTRGSRHESEETLGIYHLLEHMVFKGTEKRTAKDIAYQLESVGGSLNAFTEHEYTCYHARILDEHLNLALELISDLLLNSVFDEHELEKEKQVVFEEMKNLQDTPDEMVHQLFRESIWGDGPLGRSGLGTDETISAITAQVLREHIGNEYSSNRLVVAVAGNVDHQELVDSIGNYFDLPGPNGRSSADETDVDVPLQDPTQAHFTSDISQTHLCMGTVTFSHSHRLRFPLLVLNSALGGGMSSKLFQTIREREGLAYSVYSFQQFYEDTGFGGTYVGVEPVNVERTVDLVLTEYRDVLKNGLAQEELDGSKNQLIGQLMIGLESTNARMYRLAGYELNGEDFLSMDEVIRRVKDVSMDHIKEVAQIALAPERLWRVSLGPKSSAVDDGKRQLIRG